jgi:ribonuclease G
VLTAGGAGGILELRRSDLGKEGEEERKGIEEGEGSPRKGRGGRGGKGRGGKGREGEGRGGKGREGEGRGGKEREGEGRRGKEGRGGKGRWEQPSLILLRRCSPKRANKSCPSTSTTPSLTK